jgi:hypothetical protein
MRMGGPQSQSERGGEEKNSEPLPGPKPQIIQPVAQRYTTELSRLHYPKSQKKLSSGMSWAVNNSGRAKFPRHNYMPSKCVYS